MRVFVTYPAAVGPLSAKLAGFLAFGKLAYICLVPSILEVFEKLQNNTVKAVFGIIYNKVPEFNSFLSCSSSWSILLDQFPRNENVKLK